MKNGVKSFVVLLVLCASAGVAEAGGASGKARKGSVCGDKPRSEARERTSRKAVRAQEKKPQFHKAAEYYYFHQDEYRQDLSPSLHERDYNHFN